MNDQESDRDVLVVQDAAGRRRFMRRGAAIIAAAAPLVASGQALADCDRNGNSHEQKRAAAATSDSDQGANADPAGCGRREAPKISRATPDDAPSRPISVDTVRG